MTEIRSPRRTVSGMTAVLAAVLLLHFYAPATLKAVLTLSGQPPLYPFVPFGSAQGRGRLRTALAHTTP